MTAPSPDFHSPSPSDKGGPHEQPVIELVEVPFVEQEQVERAELRGETHREPRVDDVEDVGDGDADQGQRSAA